MYRLPGASGLPTSWLVWYMEAPPEELMLVEFLDSSRVPSVSFQCNKVMNDPPVETPVV